ARRSLFDLGDYRRLLLADLFLQSTGEAAHRIGCSSQTLQFGQANPCPPFGNFLGLSRNNLLEDRGHAHRWFSCLKIEVKDTSSSSRSRARPVCSTSWATLTPSRRLLAISAAYRAAPAFSTMISAAFWPFSICRRPSASRIVASEPSATSTFSPLRL